MKSAFQIGTEVMLVLEPLDEYFEMIWAANSVGIVTGYNILYTLVIVQFDNGEVIPCGPKLLQSAGGFDI